MKPRFEQEDATNKCEFYPIMPDNYVFSAGDFFIANTYTATKDGKKTIVNGKIAVYELNKWKTENAIFTFDPEQGIYTRYLIVCHDKSGSDLKIAYPIDPNMSEKDVNGATIIESNASNNGWIFAHATKAEHIDRIWLASTAMSSIFDKVMEDKLQQTLASIINNPQTNQQRGVYLRWADMLDFKKDCTAYCVRFEKLLYLGQHKQQRGLNLRDMLLLCIKHVKQEWQKVQDKFDGVSGDVNSIISALEADHNFETRWEQEARQKREAAAREAENE